jgi:hypothetical protein
MSEDKNNLLDYDGKKIEIFIYGDGTVVSGYKNDIKYRLKIEERNGEMAYVKDVFIVGYYDGIEVERWNFKHILGVEWATD